MTYIVSTYCRNQQATAKGINNTVMELRTICNHPFLSRLHPEHGEDRLTPGKPR